MGNRSSNKKIKSAIFLDIDGVLNTPSFVRENWQGRDLEDYSVYLIKDLVLNLKEALENLPHVGVVIHSHWAVRVPEVKILEALKKQGLDLSDRFLGLTPKKMSSYKCNEINWWLNENDHVTDYLIIDNDDIGLDFITEAQKGKRKRQTHLMTNENQGLTNETAQSLVDWFSGKDLPDKYLPRFLRFQK